MFFGDRPIKDCRFRINTSKLCYWPFVLERRCIKKLSFGRVRVCWDTVWASFATREEARAHYELIKDLPEYLP